MSNWSSIKEIIAAVKAGEIVIMVDDAKRENEGDLIMAGEKANATAVNFMIKKGGGLLCAPCEETILKRLNLQQMVSENSDPHQTRFTISIDAKTNSTGISCPERAETIRLLANPTTASQDFSKPGHVFPISANPNGVLARPGHTETAVDLAKLAGLAPVGVICEIINDKGTMARKKELLAFAEKYSLKIAPIADLIKYQLQNTPPIQLQTATNLPTRFGNFYLLVFKSIKEKLLHIAIIKSRQTKKILPEQNENPKKILNENFLKLKNAKSITTRIHSECFTGDVLSSLRCDCGEQLAEALKTINKADQGVLLYLRQEGRGIGLVEKIRAYNLQNEGVDTYDANIQLGHKADPRNYSEGIAILKQLGIQSVKLLTNNPEKIRQINDSGLKVETRLPLLISPQTENKEYLKTKKDRFGHLL